MPRHWSNGSRFYTRVQLANAEDIGFSVHLHTLRSGINTPATDQLDYIRITPHAATGLFTTPAPNQISCGQVCGFVPAYKQMQCKCKGLCTRTCRYRCSCRCRCRCRWHACMNTCMRVRNGGSGGWGVHQPGNRFWLSIRVYTPVGHYSECSPREPPI